MLTIQFERKATERKSALLKRNSKEARKRNIAFREKIPTLTVRHL